MKAKISILLIICIVLSIFSGCNFFKDDKELINDRLESFLKAYNSGDLEKLIECMDSKTKNTYKSAINIGESIGSKFGINLKASDLFGLSVGMISETALITFSDINIDILENDNAKVNLCMTYEDKYSSKRDEYVTFLMIKENNDWFIKDIN